MADGFPSAVEFVREKRGVVEFTESRPTERLSADKEKERCQSLLPNATAARVVKCATSASSATGAADQERTVYGCLYVIGTRKRYMLEERKYPNGIKRVCHHHLSQNTAEEYISDDETDMFQVGKGGESIDFRVDHPCVPQYACRISVARSNPADIRIYAGAFNANKKISLKKHDFQWLNDDGVDGFLKNGVLLCHLKGSFGDEDVEAGPGPWMELSLNGKLFPGRSSRSSPEKRNEIEDATNILRDGSMIDLCGVTILWRTSEALKKCPSKQDLERCINGRYVASRESNMTLFKIPRSNSTHKADDVTKLHPFIYFNCGHIWITGQSRNCPVCDTPGSSTKLCMGMTSAFYVDRHVNSHSNLCVFKHCGHMATAKTVQYWSNVPLPHGLNSYSSMCPFCKRRIEGFPGYVALNL